MAEEKKRKTACIIVINENGEKMKWPPENGTNEMIAYILGEAGILTEELSNHLSVSD